MPLVDLLNRFRRLGAPPGPPARPVGIPASGGEALLAELAPLFAALDAIGDEATAIRADAERRAADLRSGASSEAGSIVAQARAAAADARREAAAERQRAMRGEAERVRVDAEREVARIRAQARAQLSALVAVVVDCVHRGPL